MASRFLVDVGVGKKVEIWLDASEHDTKNVRDIDPRLSDTAILEIAARENRIVITMDKDFGELVFNAEQVHSGVLLLRLEGAASDEKARVVAEIVTAHTDKMEGKFSVYQSGRLRIR